MFKKTGKFFVNCFLGCLAFMVLMVPLAILALLGGDWDPAGIDYLRYNPLVLLVKWLLSLLT